MNLHIFEKKKKELFRFFIDFSMEVSSRNLTPAEITALDDLIRYVIHMFYSDPEIVFMDLLLNSHRE